MAVDEVQCETIDPVVSPTLLSTLKTRICS